MMAPTSSDPYEVHREEYKGYLIKIIQDQDCATPRDNDNFGSIILSARYKGYGDEEISRYYDSAKDWLRNLAADEVGASDVNRIKDKHIERILNKYFVILPIDVYRRYDGDKLKISPSLMDETVDGYIYATKSQVLKEYSVDDLDSPMDDGVSARDRAERLFRAEVEELSLYLQGECYGYVIEDSEGEMMDSCWGYIGKYDDPEYSVLREAKSMVDYYVKLDERFKVKLYSRISYSLKLVAGKLLTWAQGVKGRRYLR